MQEFTHQDVEDRVLETLSSITVAVLTSLSKRDGKIDLWYDATGNLYHLGSYCEAFGSVVGALGWYEKNIDNEYGIWIKEL